MAEAANWLDGNALGGALLELFGADLTDAPRRCQSCGATHAVGAHRLYLGAGSVLRCPSCDAVALVLTTLPDRHGVSMPGTWHVPRADVSDER